MQKPNVPPKLAHLIIILSSVFSPFSPPFKTTAPFNKSLTLPLLSPSHHPFTHPFKLPPPLIHTLPLVHRHSPIPRTPFSLPSNIYDLQHSSFQLPSSIHKLVLSPFISPHPCKNPTCHQNTHNA